MAGLVDVSALGEAKHLERERALKSLIDQLKRNEELQEHLASIESGLVQLLQEAAWEKKLGGLLGAKAVVQLCSRPDFDASMVGHALTLLEDEEPRVRAAVGEVLGALAAKMGPPVWIQAKPAIMRSIMDNYDRDGEGGRAGDDAPSTSTPPGARSPRSASPVRGAAGLSGADLISSLLDSAYKPKVPGQGEMRHGTEGWRCLESSMRAMVAVLQGLGAAAAAHVTRDIIDLMKESMHHPNRFVREAAHGTCCAVCVALASAGPADAGGAGDAGAAGATTSEGTAAAAAAAGGGSSGSDDCQQPPFSLQQLGAEIAPLLADGLTDSWSQVRYTASVATRTFMQCLGTHAARAPFYAHLLPPMCLNRYYVAEGVRGYSQETWQQVMGDQGRPALAAHIDQVASYYIAQSKAVNHSVREAACACMAELAEKVSREAVEPHMAAMLRALLMCFKDMAWPVRDAACVACGRCVLAYPEACRPQLGELLDLWVAHLWDNVQSVRENSARALADALRAYPDGEPLARVKAALSEFLPKVHEQQQEAPRGRAVEREHPAGRAASPGGSGGASSPGRAASPGRTIQLGRPRTQSPSRGRPLSPARAKEQEIKAALACDPFASGEDMLLFSDSAVNRFNTTYYVKGDGCMDFGFSRDQEPWEATDGAVYMIRELASVLPQEAASHLQPLADITTACAVGALSFEASPKLRESVWKCFPVMGKSLGKQLLKRHLEPFLRPLFLDLSCGAPLTETAAGKAVAWLRDTLGPNILAARLTDAQAHALRTNLNIPPPSMPALGGMGGAGIGLGGGFPGGAATGFPMPGSMQPGFGMGLGRAGVEPGGLQSGLGRLGGQQLPRVD